MSKEVFFNINTMLKNLFESLDQECQYKIPNLIFVFSKTVPCQMKGHASLLYLVLLKVMRKILENKCNTEIVIYVDAPKEFLYKEKVTFTIANTPVKSEEVLLEIKSHVASDLLTMNATLVASEDHGGSIVLTSELSNAELGCRRHYRLPSKDMLDKNILLVIEGNTLALSLTKMFKYFPMNVDICIHSYKEKYNLSDYDLIVIEENMFDFQLRERIVKAQKLSALKFVLIGKEDVYEEKDTSRLHTVYLTKPVTQESIFKLLITLFDDLPKLG